MRDFENAEKKAGTGRRALPFPASVPENALAIINALEEAGYEAALVGGCVRDAVAGETPDDYDIATSALPHQTARVLRASCGFRTDVRGDGLAFGTVIACVPDEFGFTAEEYEITTFRAESGYSDGRHPDEVSFGVSLEEDLARRDFTINAMAWTPSRGLVDPFDGRGDLERRVIRCVGDPDARFAEDALRILRAVRFAATKGCSVDEKTSDAIHRAVAEGLLANASAPRIGKEMSKMLACEGGNALLSLLLEYGDVVCSAVPHMEEQLGYDQTSPHHAYTLYEHSARTCALIPPAECGDGGDAFATAPTHIRRLAGLLHDVGKPSCRSIDDDGVAHYRDHGNVGAAMASDAVKRLGYGARNAEIVRLAVKYHDAPMNGLRKTVSRRMSKLEPYGEEAMGLLIDLRRADIVAHGVPSEAEAPLRHVAEFEAAYTAMRAEDAALTVRALAIDGNDLIALGYERGPAIGAELMRLLDAVSDGECGNDAAALAARAKEDLAVR